MLKGKGEWMYIIAYITECLYVAEFLHHYHLDKKKKRPT